jgi:protein SCO1/2
MTYIRTLLLLFTVIISFNACEPKEKNDLDHVSYQCPMKCEGEKAFNAPGVCKVCKMDLEPLEPRNIEQNEISDMSIYNLPSVWTNQDNQEIKLIDMKGDILVMVMIYTSCQVACPRLVADMRAIEKGIPDSAKRQVKFAVLAVNYKKISPMDFSHSNIISVFDQQGELVHQKEGLGVDSKKAVIKILELTC